jgi:hypothetical protein
LAVIVGACSLSLTQGCFPTQRLHAPYPAISDSSTYSSLALLLINSQGFLVIFPSKNSALSHCLPVMVLRINMARFSFASLLIRVDDQNQQVAQWLHYWA